MRDRKGYAIGMVRDVEFGRDIAECLERIDATLAPFQGRFLIHGNTPDLREGEHPRDIVVIEFPSRQLAEEWYDSDAYRAILPLRTEHSQSTVVIAEGVEPGHRATTSSSGSRLPDEGNRPSDGYSTPGFDRRDKGSPASTCARVAFVNLATAQ